MITGIAKIPLAAYRAAYKELLKYLYRETTAERGLFK